MNHIPLEPVITVAMNGFIFFFMPVAVIAIILKLIVYSFEQKIKAPKRENKTKGYEMNKKQHQYNTFRNNYSMLGFFGAKQNI